MKQILIALLFVGIVQESAANFRHTIGVARDATDNSVRYIEHHQYGENGEHEVRYFDPGQNVLLEKQMAYEGLPQHPSIEQTDFVSDTNISIRYETDQATMVTSQGESSENFTFDLSPDIVVDAGFDAYVRENWDNFTTGKARDVTFAIAGQKRLLAMKIKRTSIDDSGASFKVEPANWLVRLLLPEIQLSYDAERRLTRYEGFSNLKPTSGQSRTVVIEFSHYQLDNDLEEPLPQWLPKDALD